MYYRYISKDTFAKACDVIFPAGHSAADIAAALGISRPTYYQYRQGRLNVPVEMAVKIFKAAHTFREERDRMEAYLESIVFPVEDMAPGYEAASDV